MRMPAVAAMACAGVLAMTATASSDGTAPAVTVAAAGNAFTGGLKFDPASVAIKVGDVVRWTNTDSTVPHTATEDHGLWDLGGSYGATPVNPSGFAPGASVSRAFEAGTARYYCRIHPQQMKGVVAVPVTLAVAHPPAPAATHRRRHHHRHHRRPKPKPPAYTVTLTWAAAAPSNGEGFDVEVKTGTGDWTPLHSGTTDTGTTIAGRGTGVRYTVRARLRKLNDSAAATDWSPDASVTT